MTDELTSEPGTPPAPIPLRVTLDVTVTPEHLKAARYVIVAAIEGGINYWANARVLREVTSDEGYYDRVRIWEEDESVEGRGPVSKTIGPMDILQACVKLLQRSEMKNEYHIKAARDLLFDPENNDHDADTADVLVQLALFDDIIYG